MCSSPFLENTLHTLHGFSDTKERVKGDLRIWIIWRDHFHKAIPTSQNLAFKYCRWGWNNNFRKNESETFAKFFRFHENLVYFRDNESFRENHKISQNFFVFAKNFLKIAYNFRENFLENEKRRFSRKFTFQL
jgi:hypothetical protein